MKTLSTTTRDSVHESPMRQRVNINGTELFVDVPAVFGGKDSAPTPHDYVDTALIACKAITIRMIAAKQKVPLQDVNITLNSDASKENSDGVYTMNLEFEFIGDLSGEQRQMLLEAAEQYCPVGRMLTGKIRIEMIERII